MIFTVSYSDGRICYQKSEIKDKKSHEKVAVKRIKYARGIKKCMESTGCIPNRKIRIA